MRRSGFLRRLIALCRKETFQILRDPSSNLIAFVLPILMLFIYSYGINLDSTAINIGVVLEDSSREARQFADSLIGSPYMRVVTSRDRQEMEKRMVEGSVRGFLIIPEDFQRRLERPTDSAPLLVITDGAEPNMANFVESYARGAWLNWMRYRAGERGKTFQPPISLEPRYWFNSSAESRNYIIPGSITVIMTVIGALLTSLVVAREWERGTMEALLATPITKTELLLSKIIPYYVLGIVSLLICVAVAVLVLDVPMRGSLWVLIVVASLFLGGALGFGLLLSTVTRNQFNAAQGALNGAFLPALILSGFIYEIRSMPLVIQAVCYLIPARYFVSAMQTIFMAGNVWSVLLRNMLFLAIASAYFLGLTALKTRRRLE